MRLSFTIIGLAAALSLGPIAGATADTAKVDKVVVLMRHGVRPPTNTGEIAPFAADPWPNFGVPDGMLTPNGAEGARKLGAWERGPLVERGVIPASGCPTPTDLFAWSSRELRRTTDTGVAFLAGMFPGCGLTVGKSAGEGPDPLYTASETDVGRVDFEVAKKAILDAMGGSFDRPKARLAGLMNELQNVTHCCSVEVCQKALGRNDCRIDELPWAIKPSSGGRNVKIEGPLSTAATMSQVFLLEYAQGLSPAEIAWGRAAKLDDVIRLSELRKIKYEYFERVPYIARRGSSNILAQIATVLTRGTDVDTGLKLQGPPDARLTLYVGSDTQIAQISGMLGLTWRSTGYLADETPPTGGLMFERLVEPSGARSTRISFITPTPDQLRGSAPLDAANPPSVTAVPIPECDAGGVCPLPKFGEILRAKIDATAVAPMEYR